MAASESLSEKTRSRSATTTASVAISFRMVVSNFCASLAMRSASFMFNASDLCCKLLNLVGSIDATSSFASVGFLTKSW